jgi:BASS family bile acid:Na+ symporter
LGWSSRSQTSRVARSPALALVLAVEPPPTVALALVVLGACPGGAFPNLYCCIVQAGLALSVTLTGLSTVAAVALPPALLPWLIALLG